MSPRTWFMQLLFVMRDCSGEQSKIVTPPTYVFSWSTGGFHRAKRADSESGFWYRTKPSRLDHLKLTQKQIKRSFDNLFDEPHTRQHGTLWVVY
jgi:hypothetical protein